MEILNAVHLETTNTNIWQLSPIDWEVLKIESSTAQEHLETTNTNIWQLSPIDWEVLKIGSSRAQEHLETRPE
ncbi:hypothetical protein J6590_070048 [Homalodisca vitripennis]|nr:hypothetical protein J6590_070048 [Homalodisca vitripennis]